MSEEWVEHKLLCQKKNIPKVWLNHEFIYRFSENVKKSAS